MRLEVNFSQILPISRQPHMPSLAVGPTAVGYLLLQISSQECTYVEQVAVRGQVELGVEFCAGRCCDLRFTPLDSLPAPTIHPQALVIPLVLPPRNSHAVRWIGTRSRDSKRVHSESGCAGRAGTREFVRKRRCEWVRKRPVSPCVWRCEWGRKRPLGATLSLQINHVGGLQTQQFIRNDVWGHMQRVARQ
jgi:hypothetical protein